MVFDLCVGRDLYLNSVFSLFLNVAVSIFDNSLQVQLDAAVLAAESKPTSFVCYHYSTVRRFVTRKSSMEHFNSNFICTEYYIKNIWAKLRTSSFFQTSLYDIKTAKLTLVSFLNNPCTQAHEWGFHVENLGILLASRLLTRFIYGTCHHNLITCTWQRKFQCLIAGHLTQTIMPNNFWYLY